MLQKLETTLDGFLGKKSPVKLPEEARKSIAHVMWILALVFGVLQLWATWELWDLGRKVNEVVSYFNSFSSYYGGSHSEGLGVFFWLAVVAMGVVAVMTLLAAPHLKAMKKAGWNLLFYAALIEAVVAVLRLFSDIGGGFGNFLAAALGALISAFLLFQVRDYFTGAKSAAPAPAHKEK